MIREVNRFTRGALALAVTLIACGDTGTSDDAPPVDAPNTAPVAQPVEWVGYHTEMPLVPGDFHALASGLFGEAAEGNQLIAEKEIVKGLFIGAQPEPTTPDQVRIKIAFDDGTPERRTIALAPASFEIGKLFVGTVDAALAKMQADNAATPKSGEVFFLEYRLYSAQGGRLSFGVRGDHGTYSLVIDVTTPQMSIAQGSIGKGAFSGAPHDSIAGTVWFGMTRDDFAYFVDHAYGKGSVGRHNFKDFVLVPFDWLRLTVEPHLKDRFVNVGFEVLGLEGKRTPFARAPASTLAGATFERAVLHNMDVMNEQEKTAAGSSTPFRVPFYYDAPDRGGGIVQVVAEGNAGNFRVAYAVESPFHTLRDVPLLEYKPVEIPDEDPNALASCEKLGDPGIVLADKGTLDLTFEASKVIKESKERTVPLRGKIACSVFYASDVHVDGPVPGAVTLQDFVLDDADLEGPSPPSFTTKELRPGDYQVLCYQDLDKSDSATPGDPVTLPIGSYTTACNKNPFTVEFAILYPKNR